MHIYLSQIGEINVDDDFVHLGTNVHLLLIFFSIKLIWTRVFSLYMVQTSSNRIWYHLFPRQETIDEPSNRKHPMFSFILQKTVIIFDFFLNFRLNKNYDY
jgi:hypothetical protein